MAMNTLFRISLLLLCSSPLLEARAEIPLVDKTLVAWVTLSNLTQRGGSALTIEDRDAHFDAMVFGELAPARWMAGSDFYRRTLRSQDSLAPENSSPGALLQIAIVYRGPEVIVYRNGLEYSRHALEQPQFFDEQGFVLI